MAGCHLTQTVLRCGECTRNKVSDPRFNGGWRGRLIGRSLSALLERALIDQWEVENTKHAGTSPILPALLASESQRGSSFGNHRDPSMEEWNASSRVLQWLGTNVGRCFLLEASNRFELYRRLAEQEVFDEEAAMVEQEAAEKMLERQLEELTGLS